MNEKTNISKIVEAFNERSGTVHTPIGGISNIEWFSKKEVCRILVNALEELKKETEAEKYFLDNLQFNPLKNV